MSHKVFIKQSNLHQEDQANDLQPKQQLNSTLLMLTHEETYQTAQPATEQVIEIGKQSRWKEKNGSFCKTFISSDSSCSVEKGTA